MTKENIRRVRPGLAMKPEFFNNILGKKVKKDVKIGERVKKGLIND